MREGVASVTSIAVSYMRAIGRRGRTADAFAPKWLPQPLSLLAKTAQGPSLRAKAVRAASHAVGFGLVSHIVRRTEIIDNEVEQAVGAGVRQVVLLGAGLDARAWRMASLAGCRVFELDHPSTQKFKRRVANTDGAVADVVFVSVDFAEQRFADRLLDEGYAINEPALVIWEGVAMYLPEAAVVDTIEQIKTIAARGSRVVWSYAHEDSLLTRPGLGRVIRSGFTLLGESLEFFADLSTFALFFGDGWSLSEQPCGEPQALERVPDRLYALGERVGVAIAC